MVKDRLSENKSKDPLTRKQFRKHLRQSRFTFDKRLRFYKKANQRRTSVKARSITEQQATTMLERKKWTGP